MHIIYSLSTEAVQRSVVVGEEGNMGSAISSPGG
jgi:hypothetical protein